VHQIDVLDKGTPQRSSYRIPAPILDEATPDLLLDLTPKLLDTGPDLLT
jgi:hypothetical protein